jgi:hypothetical protein
MKSYYVRTDEGLEIVNGVVCMRDHGCPSSDGVKCDTHGDVSCPGEYQVMYTDSIVGEGTFCYDYVDLNGTADELRNFLNRNLDR